MSFIGNIFQYMSYALTGGTTTPPAPGDPVAMQMTPSGALLVRYASMTPLPTYSVDFLGAAYGVIRSVSPSTIFQVVFTNDGLASRRFMIFDTPGPGAPPDGTVPKFSFIVAPGQLVALETARGRVFRGPGVGGTGAGISWAISSTPGVLTFDAAATFSVTAEYS